MADYYCVDGMQSDEPLTMDDPDECIDVYLSHLRQNDAPQTIVLVGYAIAGDFDEETASYPLRVVSEEEIDVPRWMGENWSDHRVRVTMRHITTQDSMMPGDSIRYRSPKQVWRRGGRHYVRIETRPVKGSSEVSFAIELTPEASLGAYEALTALMDAHRHASDTEEHLARFYKGLREFSLALSGSSQETDA